MTHAHVRIFAAACLAAVFTAGQAEAFQEQNFIVPTEAQCTAAWERSSANDSCGSNVSETYPHAGTLPAAEISVWKTEQTVSLIPGRTRGPKATIITAAGCQVKVQCAPASESFDEVVHRNLGVHNDWKGELDDTPGLVNSDGTLVVE